MSIVSMPIRSPYAATTVVILLISTGGVHAAETTRGAKPLDAETSSARRVVVQTGLAWLASQQAPDGSFGNLSHYGPHVGITGLAAMAFMSEGSMPGRGTYGRTVDQCLAFVVDHGSESGLLAA